MLHNDIAVLMLERRAKLDENVNIIQLARKHETYLNMKVTMAGWGMTEKEDQPRRLKSVTAAIVTNKECDIEYSVSRIPYSPRPQSPETYVILAKLKFQGLLVWYVNM